VGSFSAILPGQLDAVAFQLIDGADMNAVRAYYFHVLFDFGHFAHPL
jgi:hypothetical protein